MKIQITRNLWAKWENYSARVSYAQTYQKIVSQAGEIANDHIAFRSLPKNWV